MIPVDIDTFLVYSITDYYSNYSIFIKNPIYFIPKELSNCTMLHTITTLNRDKMIKIETLRECKLNNVVTELDISGLARCKSLTRVDLDHNNITDISALSKCVSLNCLSLQNNKIIDISALSKCTSLTNLYLQHNKIVDISALSKCTKFKIVNFEYNRIKDGSVLSKLKRLKCSSLKNNRITCK